jgi:Asp-tRNA(Asn)/Glu-tRNA(Gln) amidotransferase A subunit family amidase
MSIPTNFLTATETQALLASGKTTISQVIQDHKDRFDDRDPVVRAWVTTNWDQYQLADTEGLPLHGVIPPRRRLSEPDWPDIEYHIPE